MAPRRRCKALAQQLLLRPYPCASLASRLLSGSRAEPATADRGASCVGCTLEASGASCLEEDPPQLSSPWQDHHHGSIFSDSKTHPVFRSGTLLPSSIDSRGHGLPTCPPPHNSIGHKTESPGKDSLDLLGLSWRIGQGACQGTRQGTRQGLGGSRESELAGTSPCLSSAFLSNPFLQHQRMSSSYSGAKKGESGPGWMGEGRDGGEAEEGGGGGTREAVDHSSSSSGGAWWSRGTRGTSKAGGVRKKRVEFQFPEVNAEETVRALEENDQRTKDKFLLSSEEKKQIKELLRHFADSGWAADQALAIYINSRFFPSAAAKFRKFVLRCCTRELAQILMSSGEPRAASDEFLFPIFAEYCFNAFGAEIKSYRELVESADMTKPHTWYPHTRALKRKIIYHMGPTNSGKTHQALIRFKEAESGIYCGPLRLLAMEVFDRVNADGVYCNLITGQERKEMPFARHTACTVEMANLFQPVEVAVIDEIQMINDKYRGWAWTRALLGTQAKELHVCGDPSALEVLKELCDVTGDDFLCSSYSRFAPLTVDQRSLKSDIGAVQSGDCIIAFSRRDIFDIKRSVEVLGRQRCCVVYGALPPETRRQQAQLFNEEDNGFEVLVASDAVGMGLNLNIRRIVFSTLTKFNGESKIPIPAPMVKQIAGRAGRRGSKYEEGVVTCLHSADVPQLMDALTEDVLPIQDVGLFPVFEQVELFASQLPEMTFAQLLNQFVETSRVDGLYFLCRTDNLLKVASMLDKVKGLSLRDRFHFCFAPVSTRDPAMMSSLLEYAQSYAAEEPVKLNLPNSSALIGAALSASRASATAGNPRPSQISFQLLVLEGQHQVASMYLWLSQHFPDEMFPDKQLASDLAEGVAQQLGASLVKPLQGERDTTTTSSSSSVHNSSNRSAWRALPEKLKQVGRRLGPPKTRKMLQRRQEQQLGGRSDVSADTALQFC